jgi:hypothetical protein
VISDGRPAAPPIAVCVRLSVPLVAPPIASFALPLLIRLTDPPLPARLEKEEPPLPPMAAPDTLTVPPVAELPAVGSAVFRKATCGPDQGIGLIPYKGANRRKSYFWPKAEVRSASLACALTPPAPVL